MTLDSDHNLPGLIEHFERTLGPVSYGWAGGAEKSFQIVRYSRGSDARSVGYSTLGLSRRALLSPNSQKLIRQELLMLASDSVAPQSIAAILQQVGGMVSRSGRPLLRGDVIGPAGALMPGAAVTALYATMPSYFPVEFATFDGDAHGKVVIAWLVPITDREASFVAQFGWDAFEDQLVEQDPDLVDLSRPQMNL